MPRVRYFALEDARSGARFPLDGSRGVYFSAPEGLGFELDPTMADLRFGFFAPVVEDAEPQGELVGRLEILPPAYETYRTLVDWMARVPSGQLRFIYSPVPAVEVFKLVLPASISKGELDKTRLLLCPCTFRALTPWTRPLATEVAVTGAEEALRYTASLRYDSALRYAGDAAGQMSAMIYPAGHLPGSILLRYTGEISDPRIKLTGAESGTVYGICAVEDSLGASEALELATMREDSHCVKIAADGSEIDLVAAGAVDLSQEPFFSVPVTEPSILTIESTAVISGTAELQVFTYYRSV